MGYFTHVNGTDLGTSMATSALCVEPSADTCNVDTPTNTPRASRQSVGEERRVTSTAENSARPSVAFSPALHALPELVLQLSIFSTTVPVAGSSENSMVGLMLRVSSVERVTIRVRLLAELECHVMSPCSVATPNLCV